MQIRPESAADHDAIADVIRLAFGRDAEAKLVDALRREPDFIPALSLVAVNDARDHTRDNLARSVDETGLIVGHIFFSPIKIGATPALALAPLAVRPEFQRQGIGSALVRAAHAAAAQLGHRIVVVVGHPEYYPKFGFTPARACGLEAPFPVPDPAFLVVELQPGALEGVRGMVSYVAPFGSV
jgi:putative acetyltransferase